MPLELSFASSFTGMRSVNQVIWSCIRSDAMPVVLWALRLHYLNRCFHIFLPSFTGNTLNGTKGKLRSSCSTSPYYSGGNLHNGRWFLERLFQVRQPESSVTELPPNYILDSQHPAADLWRAASFCMSLLKSFQCLHNVFGIKDTFVEVRLSCRDVQLPVTWNSQMKRSH